MQLETIYYTISKIKKGKCYYSGTSVTPWKHFHSYSMYLIFLDDFRRRVRFGDSDKVMRITEKLTCKPMAVKSTIYSDIQKDILEY